MATTNTQKGNAAQNQGEKKAKRRVLHVHCTQERFRRGGRDFVRGKNVVPADELSKEQYKAIKAEPLLAVTEHDEDVEPEAGA